MEITPLDYNALCPRFHLFFLFSFWRMFLIFESKGAVEWMNDEDQWEKMQKQKRRAKTVHGQRDWIKKTASLVSYKNAAVGTRILSTQKSQILKK